MYIFTHKGAHSGTYIVQKSFPLSPSAQAVNLFVFFECLSWTTFLCFWMWLFCAGLSCSSAFLAHQWRDNRGVCACTCVPDKCFFLSWHSVSPSLLHLSSLFSSLCTFLSSSLSLRVEGFNREAGSCDSRCVCSLLKLLYACLPCCSNKGMNKKPFK